MITQPPRSPCLPDSRLPPLSIPPSPLPARSFQPLLLVPVLRAHPWDPHFPDARTPGDLSFGWFSRRLPSRSSPRRAAPSGHPDSSLPPITCSPSANPVCSTFQRQPAFALAHHLILTSLGQAIPSSCLLTGLPSSALCPHPTASSQQRVEWPCEH